MGVPGITEGKTITIFLYNEYSDTSVLETIAAGKFQAKVMPPRKGNCEIKRKDITATMFARSG